MHLRTGRRRPGALPRVEGALADAPICSQRQPLCLVPLDPGERTPAPRPEHSFEFATPRGSPLSAPLPWSTHTMAAATTKQRMRLVAAPRALAAGPPAARVERDT